MPVFTAEPADAEEGRTEALLMKEEGRKDEQPSSDPQGDHSSSAERAVETSATAGGRPRTANTQTPPSHPPEQQRTRRGVREVRGMKTVSPRKAKRGRVNQTPQHRGTQRGAGGLNGLDSEFAMFERPAGRPGTYCPQGGANAEAEDPCCSYSAGTDSEIPCFRPEMRSFPAAEEGAGKGLSSLGYTDWKPEVVAVQTFEGGEPKRYQGDGEGEAQWHAANGRPRYPQTTASGMRAPSDSHTGDPHGRCPRADQFSLRHVEEDDEEEDEEEEEEPGGFGQESHRTARTGERPFGCAQCGKTFAHPGRLRVHQRVHTGEKPFSCAQCGKRFSQSSHIKRHQRVHTGEKPFGCAQCEKRFSHLCNLKTHQTVHTGERPHSCTQCGKSFSSLGNLIRHQSVHIGK